jgi:hypothetical protein
MFLDLVEISITDFLQSRAVIRNYHDCLYQSYQSTVCTVIRATTRFVKAWTLPVRDIATITKAIAEDNFKRSGWKMNRHRWSYGNDRFCWCWW